MAAIRSGAGLVKRVLIVGGRALACSLGLLLVGLGLWALVPPGTREIRGEHAIAELQSIDLGRFRQTVLLRGTDRRHPVLLYVHGGPGSAQLPIARRYSARLEQHFLVVHWDQRGAGASCAGVDWSTLSLERIVSDTIELAVRLGQGRKIFLVGHSWGSLVGAMAVDRPPIFSTPMWVPANSFIATDRNRSRTIGWSLRPSRPATRGC